MYGGYEDPIFTDHIERRTWQGGADEFVRKLGVEATDAADATVPTTAAIATTSYSIGGDCADD